MNAKNSMLSIMILIFVGCGGDGKSATIKKTDSSNKNLAADSLKNLFTKRGGLFSIVLSGSMHGQLDPCG